MPSLKQLEEFKTSFRDIGNEAVVLARQNIPIDDLPLPTTEPIIPPEAPEPAAPEGDMDFPLADEAPPGEGETALAGEEDFDFGAFLDTIPDDLSLPVPDIPDIPDIPPQTGDDDFNAPDSLLEGLTGDIETPEADSADLPPDSMADFPPEPDFGEDLLTGASPADEAAPSGEADSLGDFPAMDDFADFSIPDMEEETKETAADIPPLSDDVPPSEDDAFNLDLPDDDAFSLFSEESPPPPVDFPEEEMDIPEEPGAAPAEAAEGENLEFLFPDEDIELSPPEADTGGEEPAAGIGEAEGLALAEEAPPGVPPDSSPAADTQGPESSGDIFESFSLDNEEAPDAFEAPGEKPPDSGSGEFAELEEFALTGIDDIFNKSAKGTAGPSGTVPSKEAVEEVEEIHLSDEELARLQETLASYPLNLRIACEELIAEQVVTPNLMSSLVKLLVKGASPRETASLAGKILGRTIPVPRGFEKKTGEALEIEQASFSYIFVHKFLPILRLVMFIALTALSLVYLIYRFIYIPAWADSVYQAGYERIEAGEFARANDRFTEAFRLHPVKNWFYRYAEAFRDRRQYIYAEEKYDELLRYYLRDKKGALDYADLETNYLKNYSKADRIIRRNILDYSVDDREALLALGDTNLAWGEIDDTRYEEARRAYARLLERYGWQDPIVERMMKYFIRTDNLGQVIPLQDYFLNSSRKRAISPEALAELGGYLLDKRFEEVRGVPDEHLSSIDGIRDILLKAVTEDPSLPEAHYHLARYYSRYGYTSDERQTLSKAVSAFDAAPEKSATRVKYRIDALRRYAQVLINAREFFPAEEQITQGINLYEDAVSRRLFPLDPQFGRLYADLGDLEYFTKDGNMEAAIQYYDRSERNGWAPPELHYRMGSAYYHLRQWAPALERFFDASVEMPRNRRLLYALGNTSYMRGDYHTAQGYFTRLLDILDNDRARFPLLSPNDTPEHMDLAERLMVTQNNLGVTMDALADQTGDNSYRSRALGLYAESARAWDAITRNPQTMVRAGASALSTPGVNLAYLNSRNTLNPVPDYEPQLYLHIDKDVSESSIWESIVPADYRLSDEINFYR
ncbi:tetratricopeptide repeat protein [Treponema sp. TIM-1]|uniref:periplasmic flagellar collar protein FlcA n=1 Tax=Treponema sp. TIM-1 TaxID=2898417 RepID=UPI00397F54E3